MDQVGLAQARPNHDIIVNRCEETEGWPRREQSLVRPTRVTGGTEARHKAYVCTIGEGNCEKNVHRGLKLYMANKPY